MLSLSADFVDSRLAQKHLLFSIPVLYRDTQELTFGKSNFRR